MSLRVLVVEDDVPTLELIREVLSSVGVEVVAVNDSREAPALVERERYDGIFLDLMMPHLDGFELARQVRQSKTNKNTPIVIVTGRDEKDTLRESFAAGGTFFLQKPIKSSNLYHLLNRTRGTMLNERRRHLRVSLRTDVEYWLGSHRQVGTTCNLSQSSLAFETESPPPPGARVRVKFALPGQRDPFDFAGEVEDGESNRVVVRFTFIPPKERKRLAEFVASQDEPG